VTDLGRPDNQLLNPLKSPLVQWGTLENFLRAFIERDVATRHEKFRSNMQRAQQQMVLQEI